MNNIKPPKSKLIEGTPYPGEIEPTCVRFFHTVAQSNLTGVSDYYLVHGTIFSPETNTQLPFSKEFDTLNHAEVFFNDVSKQFPYSHIIIQHRIVKDLKSYG